jgi:hypothetical protein
MAIVPSQIPARCLDGDDDIDAPDPLYYYPWNPREFIFSFPTDLARLGSHIASWAHTWLCARASSAVAVYNPPAAETSDWLLPGTVRHPAIGTPINNWIAPGFQGGAPHPKFLGISADAQKVSKRARILPGAAWIDAGWPQYDDDVSGDDQATPTIHNADFTDWPDLSALDFLERVLKTFRPTLLALARAVRATRVTLLEATPDGAAPGPEIAALDARARLFDVAAKSFTAVYITRTDPARPAGTIAPAATDELWFVCLVGNAAWVLWVVDATAASAGNSADFSF